MDVDIELLRQFYIVEQHTQLECCKHFGVGRTKLQKIIKLHNLHKTSADIETTRKRTNIQKYGYERPSSNEKVKETIRSTCRERYGVDCPLSLSEIKEKSRRTSQEKYGTDHPSQSQVVREKTKQTLKQKYNVENISQVEEIKKQKEQSALQHFGVKNPSQAQDVKEAKRNSFLRTYGVGCNLQDPDTIRKIQETIYIKYGTLHPPIMKYFYDGEFFDSSWEIALWIYAKDHNEPIVRCPCKIPYIYENTSHFTVPDFLYKGRLLELKGDQFFINGKMVNPYNHEQDGLFQAKYEAALQAGVVFWCQEEIGPILQYIDSKYGLKYLQQYRIAQSSKLERGETE